MTHEVLRTGIFGGEASFETNVANISKRRGVLALLSLDYRVAFFLASLSAANCASVAALWIWELWGLELVIWTFGLERSGSVAYEVLWA